MEQGRSRCADHDLLTYRVEEVEKRVSTLNKLLFGTLMSSISTLVGVIILILAG